MSSIVDWKSNYVEFLKGRGKIQQLAELTAVQNLQAMAAQNQRNSESEAAHVRRTVWGDETTTPSENTEMGNTILGNVTQPPPIVVTGQSSLGPVALALMTLLPIAGIGAVGAGAVAGYYLSQPAEKPVEPTDPPSYTDESVTIGLGRLEDFVNGKGGDL